MMLLMHFFALVKGEVCQSVRIMMMVMIMMMLLMHFFARVIEEVCQSVRGSKAQHTWRLLVNLFISGQFIAGMFILEEDFW